MSQKNKKYKPEDKTNVFRIIYLDCTDGNILLYDTWSMEEIDIFAKRKGIYEGGCYIIIKGGEVVKSTL